MIEDRELYINMRIVEHLEEFHKYYPNLELFYLGLQGSQNYNLDIYTDDYISDIDTKIIVLPSLEDIVLNKKPISMTHICSNNEHIDIKDIRLMFDCFKKQNINFLEILFTNYGIFNHEYKDLVKELILNRELIAHYNINQALRCMAGMSMEKRKALCHPYPTIKDKIDKYGYDGKQLHHIIRMFDFITAYALGSNFEKCLQFQPHKEEMMAAKRNKYSLEEALKMADFYNNSTKFMKDIQLKFKPQDEINQKAKKVLDKVQYESIKRYLQKQLKEG